MEVVDPTNSVWGWYLDLYSDIPEECYMCGNPEFSSMLLYGHVQVKNDTFCLSCGSTKKIEKVVWHYDSSMVEQLIQKVKRYVSVVNGAKICLIAMFQQSFHPVFDRFCNFDRKFVVIFDRFTLNRSIYTFSIL